MRREPASATQQHVQDEGRHQADQDHQSDRRVEGEVAAADHYVAGKAADAELGREQERAAYERQSPGQPEQYLGERLHALEG
jgi:hypothetical protein